MTQQPQDQPDHVGDAITDALNTAEAADTGLPVWGARLLARILANQRQDRFTCALHQFADSGRIDHDAMYRELAEAYRLATDDTMRSWINWLGSYISIRGPTSDM